MALSANDTSFDVVLKIAERCNLACSYCYYYFKEYDGNQNAATISPEAMAEVPRFLARSCDELHLDQLNIGLHGGEPLLLKKSRFDQLCTDIRAAVGHKTRLTMGLQTNGVLIDDEWIALFAKHQIGVGVSIDGSRELHDKRRVDHAGRGSYDATVAGLRKLQAAVADGRLEGAGAIGVVDVTGGEELLRELVFNLGVNSPSLNFPRGGHDCADARAWDRSLDSHRQMVRYGLERLIHPDYHFVRGITNVLLALHSDDAAVVLDRFGSLRHTVVTISSEGRVLADDNLLSVDSRFADSQLTIFGTSLRDFVESPLWQGLTEAMDYVPPKCRECEWYRSCRSGELSNRFVQATSTLEESVLCETLKMTHEEVAGFLVRKGILTVKELARRLGQRPTVSARQMVRKMLKQPDEPATQDAPVTTMQPLEFDFGGPARGTIGRDALLRKVRREPAAEPAAEPAPDSLVVATEPGRSAP